MIYLLPTKFILPKLRFSTKFISPKLRFSTKFNRFYKSHAARYTHLFRERNLLGKSYENYSQHIFYDYIDSVED